MKNKQLITISTLILLGSLSLSSHATSHNIIAGKVASIQRGYSVHSVDSSRAALSSTSVIKRKNGYSVTGDVHIKTMQRRILRLPGSITIELKNTKGEILETVQARYHRKYGISKAAHFDGTLTTTPPDGSSIVVTHNNQNYSP